MAAIVKGVFFYHVIQWYFIGKPLCITIAIDLCDRVRWGLWWRFVWCFWGVIRLWSRASGSSRRKDHATLLIVVVRWWRWWWCYWCLGAGTAATLSLICYFVLISSWYIVAFAAIIEKIIQAQNKTISWARFLYCVERLCFARALIQYDQITFFGKHLFVINQCFGPKLPLWSFVYWAVVAKAALTK